MSARAHEGKRHAGVDFSAVIYLADTTNARFKGKRGSRQVMSDGSVSYLDELRRQRETWERKGVLQVLYRYWYCRCVEHFSLLRPVVEIGGGSGNFKSYFPEAIASDLFATGNWIDLVMDAEALSFRQESIGNIIMFDVLHHLERPLLFLRQAVDSLKPNGRMVLCEPAASLWSRFVYSRFHHEPMDFDWEPLNPVINKGGRGCSANMAIPEVLFWRRRAETMKALTDTHLVVARKLGFILYPLTGGFGYRSYLPSFGLRSLLNIEDLATRPVAKWLTGMRMLVVIEKTRK